MSMRKVPDAQEIKIVGFGSFRWPWERQRWRRLIAAHREQLEEDVAAAEDDEARAAMDAELARFVAGAPHIRTVLAAPPETSSVPRVFYRPADVLKRLDRQAIEHLLTFGPDEDLEEMVNGFDLAEIDKRSLLHGLTTDLTNLRTSARRQRAFLIEEADDADDVGAGGVDDDPRQTGPSTSPPQPPTIPPRRSRPLTDTTIEVRVRPIDFRNAVRALSHEQGVTIAEVIRAYETTGTFQPDSLPHIPMLPRRTIELLLVTDPAVFMEELIVAGHVPPPPRITPEGPSPTAESTGPSTVSERHLPRTSRDAPDRTA